MATDHSFREVGLLMAGGLVTLAGTVVTQLLQWRHERRLRREERQQDFEDRKAAEEAAMDKDCIAKVEAYASLMSQFYSAVAYQPGDALHCYLLATPHHLPALAAAIQLGEKQLEDAVVRLANSGARLADEVRNGERLVLWGDEPTDDGRAIQVAAEHTRTAWTDTMNAIQLAKLKVIHGSA